MIWAPRGVTWERDRGLCAGPGARTPPAGCSPHGVAVRRSPTRARRSAPGAGSRPGSPVPPRRSARLTAVSPPGPCRRRGWRTSARWTGAGCCRSHVFLARPRGRRNQVWETDHVQAPVLVDVDGRARRPWITWFTDCATNAITGVAVTPVHPSRESVLAALRSAVLREDPYGPFGGVLEKVRVDRGRACSWPRCPAMPANRAPANAPPVRRAKCCWTSRTSHPASGLDALVEHRAPPGAVAEQDSASGVAGRSHSAAGRARDGFVDVHPPPTPRSTHKAPIDPHGCSATTLDGETQPVAVKLGARTANLKSRRDKLPSSQHAWPKF